MSGGGTVRSVPIITQDDVLDILRAHPEGITLPDLITTYYPGIDSAAYVNVYSRLHSKLVSLEKFGYVTRIPAPTRGGRGHVSVWKVVE